MELETIIQLTDTPIKIATGAAIAALTAWFIQKRAAASQQASFRELRRIEILEDVSAQVGTVSHVFAKYSALIAESIQFADRWPSSRRQELDAVNAELVDEFKKMADAESKLLMLGEKGLERALRLYGAKIAVYRKQVYIGRQDITPEQVIALKTAVTQVREQFYDMLSRKYDHHLAKA